MNRLAFLVLLATLLGAASPPKDWVLAGNSPKDYSTSLDADVKQSGNSSALLQSISANPQGFGTLMQAMQAGAFKGKRVRLSARVRSRGVQGWSGLWLRVDGGPAGPSGKGFDNMHDRPITGDTEWQTYSVVLDVAPEAYGLAYGLLLDGAGRVWIDDVSLEAVDLSVPTTGPKPPAVPDKPSNLDFEQ